MSICDQCGKELPEPGADCPVCQSPGQSGNDQGEDIDLNAAVPALYPTDDTPPDVDASSAGPTDQPKADPPARTPNTANAASAEEMRRRFEEEALDITSDAYVFRNLDKLRKHNVRAALLLGVRTTGKTWLLQRIKAALEETYDCMPPLAIGEGEKASADVQSEDRKSLEEEAASEVRQTRALSPQEAAAARERAQANDTGRTEAILFHGFISRTNSFALIDVPGERVTMMAENNFSGNRGLLAALDYASAIIVALPADVVLLGGESLDGVEEGTAHSTEFLADVQRLEELTNAIGTIAAVRSLVKHGGIRLAWKSDDSEPDEFDAKINPDTIMDHRYDRQHCQPIGGWDGMDCPAFFALTKADKIFATLEALPDKALATPAATKKYEEANALLRRTPDGELLQRIYARSELNPENKAPDNDPISRIRTLLAGPVDPATEISNPPDLVRSFNPRLFNRLTEHMPMSRFDLIAAFYGNTKSSLRRKDFKTHDAVGVDELIGWLGRLHDSGIDEWHVWARSIFRRIYGVPQEKGGVFGGAGRFSFRKRVRWPSRGLLKRMYRKEWHAAQIGPIVAGMVGAVFMSWATFDWVERTGQFADGVLYEEFKGALETSADRTVGTLPLAIAALPAIPEEVDPLQAAMWSPMQGLTAWRKNVEQGSYAVPNKFSGTVDLSLLVPAGARAPEVLNGLRLEQISWQKRYVCGLEGWGSYRAIVRHAVIKGYGDCGLATKLMLRSPAVEWLGIAGLLPLVVGWLLVGVACYYHRWFSRTRAAYAWLYHSNAATTRRRAKRPAGQA